MNVFCLQFENTQDSLFDNQIILVTRYTNNYRDSYGQNTLEYGITCRNIMTDPEIHSQLKENHAENPHFKA